jgi:hypothetical protein
MVEMHARDCNLLCQAPGDAPLPRASNYEYVHIIRQ